MFINKVPITLGIPKESFLVYCSGEKVKRTETIEEFNTIIVLKSVSAIINSC